MFRYIYLGGIIFALTSKAGENREEPKSPKLAETIEYQLEKSQRISSVNWVGIDSSGSYLASHYSVVKQSSKNPISFLSIWKGVPRKHLFTLALGESVVLPSYGSPAGFDTKGERFIIATEVGLIIGELKKPQESKSIPLPRRKGTLFPLVTFLYINPNGKDVSRLSYSLASGLMLTDRVTLGTRPEWDGTTSIMEMPLSSSLVVSTKSFANSVSKADRRAAAQEIQVRSLGKGDVKHLTTSVPSKSVSSLALSNDDKHCAAGFTDGWMRLWDTKIAKETEAVSITRSQISSIAIDPSSELLALGSFDHGGKANVWVYSIKDNRLLGSWPDNQDGTQRLSFSPDGKTLLVSSSAAIHLYILPIR